VKLARNVTVIINRLMDQWMPPVLRDSSLLMRLAMRWFAGDKAHWYLDMKDRAFFMDEETFRRAYTETRNVVERTTDLNEECVRKILSSVIGETILEAECGGGYLSEKLAGHGAVTACDVVIDEALRARNPQIRFEETRIEALPYADASFDTVVCTHTLEHVINLAAAISELRRVTKQRLIIVVPRERPYRYTFSLHVHFFPYHYSPLYAFGPGRGKMSCENAGGDWLYIEDMP